MESVHPPRGEPARAAPGRGYAAADAGSHHHTYVYADGHAHAYSFVTTTRYPRVRLRSRPDLNAPILDDLLAGEEFTAWGRTAASDWVRIRRGEQEGWSAAWTLNVEDQLPRLPVMPP